MTMLAGAPETAGLTIEEPTLADAAMMMSFEQDCWFEEARVAGMDAGTASRLMPTGVSFNNYYAAVGERLSDSAAYLRVVRRGGLVVGLVDADIDAHENNLAAIYLARCLRHQGLGSLLLANFEAELPNAAPIKLDVLQGNRPAREFYRRKGFSDVTGSRRRVAGYLDMVSMIKQRGEAV